MKMEPIIEPKEPEEEYDEDEYYSNTFEDPICENCSFFDDLNNLLWSSDILEYYKIVRRLEEYNGLCDNKEIKPEPLLKQRRKRYNDYCNLFKNRYYIEESKKNQENFIKISDFC